MTFAVIGGMLRAVAVAVLFCACTEHGETPPFQDPRNDPPDNCGCTAERPPSHIDECCDSVVCSFDTTRDEWVITFCDPPPPDPCEPCAIGTGEICVQSYDGLCGLTTACVTQTVACPDNACSAECEEAYCNAPLQCQNRVACGTESPLAFTCYGP